MSAIEDEIRKFITSELGWSGTGEALTPDYPLIDNEVLDSLGIFELVSFLEERYSFSVEDEDLVPDNFETISVIARFVTSRLPDG